MTTYLHAAPVPGPAGHVEPLTSPPPGAPPSPAPPPAAAAARRTRRGQRPGLLMAGAALGLTAALAASATASAASAAASKHAHALAHHELLAPSTYPSAWKSQGAASGNTGAGFFVGLSPSDAQLMGACLGLSTASLDTAPTEVAGPYYSDSNSGLGGSDTVEVYPTKAAAAADVAAAGAATAPGCVEKLQGATVMQAVVSGFGEGAKAAGNLSVALRPLTGVGATVADEEFSVPISYQGVSASVVSDYVFITKGHSESVLEVDNLGTPPPASLVDRLASAAAARLSPG